MSVPKLLARGLAGLMFAQALMGIVLSEQYRDAEPIRAMWIGNDWVTLVLAVPLLLAGVVHADRGSTRGLLVSLGMVAYAIYNYAFYVFGAALNAFFPLYVLLLVLAIATFIHALSRLDVALVARSFTRSTPVRAIGTCLAFIGVKLAAVWMAMWAGYVFADLPTPVAPEVFKIVAALDLSLMVPALTAGGILLWRRVPWGYVIASFASIQGTVYLLVLSVNSVIAIRRGFATAPGELPIWGTLALLATIITIVLLTNVEDETATQPHVHESSVHAGPVL